jgi:hypothetical protein
MWSLQISKDLLEYIQSRSLSSYTNINAFDFSTLYITIPHSTLQDLLKELVQEKIEDNWIPQLYKCPYRQRTLYQGCDIANLFLNFLMILSQLSKRVT